jgi:type I restriction enzyme S subunit
MARLKDVAILLSGSPVITSERYSLDRIESWTGRLFDATAELDGPGTPVLPGDVLLGKIRPYLAKVHLVKTRGDAFGTLMALRPKPVVIPEYLFWWLISPSTVDLMTGLSGGMSMPTINWDKISSIPIEIPSLAEQQRIVEFLDAKTAQIDALLEEYKGTLVTLKAHQKSLIAECVTKGIPSRRDGRPMKDSGVDWIGQIPAEWLVAPLGRFFWSEKVKVSDKDYPPLSVTKAGVVPQLETVAKTDNNDDRRRVLPGQFVINSRSDRRGSSGVSSLRGSVSLINLVMNPRQDVEMMYFHHLLRSANFTEEYYRLGSGVADDIRTTGWETMKTIPLALPALSEQTEIVDFLDAELLKSTLVVQEITKQLSDLGTYRKAIIAEAIQNGVI